VRSRDQRQEGLWLRRAAAVGLGRGTDGGEVAGGLAIAVC
jgi:hypothetical protein